MDSLEITTYFSTLCYITNSSFLDNAIKKCFLDWFAECITQFISVTKVFSCILREKKLSLTIVDLTNFEL